MKPVIYRKGGKWRVKAKDCEVVSVAFYGSREFEMAREWCDRRNAIEFKKELAKAWEAVLAIPSYKKEFFRMLDFTQRLG